MNVHGREEEQNLQEVPDASANVLEHPPTPIGLDSLSSLGSIVGLEMD